MIPARGPRIWTSFGSEEEAKEEGRMDGEGHSVRGGREGGEGVPIPGSRDNDECVDVDVDVDTEGWRVIRRTLPAKGTEKASSNRAPPFSVPLHRTSSRSCSSAIIVVIVVLGGGVDMSLYPTGSSAVPCGAPVVRAHIGRRYASVSAARYGCACGSVRKTQGACMSARTALCRAGGLAESACGVECGGSSSPSPSSSSIRACLEFERFVHEEHLGFACADGESRACNGCWRVA